jgi:hypothetical protein
MSTNNPAIFGGGTDNTTSDPNKKLGFEISIPDSTVSFAPEFYPDDFSQMKKKKLSRYGGNCGGESVSIKSIKNREFHATGIVLREEIGIFNYLIDYDGKVDLISPLTPAGGMECFIKKGEISSQKGWDPHTRQRMFEYTLDLVSTGRDEYGTGRNAIVTEIMAEAPESLNEPLNEPSNDIDL